MQLESGFRRNDEGGGGLLITLAGLNARCAPIPSYGAARAIGSVITKVAPAPAWLSARMPPW